MTAFPRFLIRSSHLSLRAIPGHSRESRPPHSLFALLMVHHRGMGPLLTCGEETLHSSCVQIWLYEERHLSIVLGACASPISSIAINAILQLTANDVCHTAYPALRSLATTLRQASWVMFGSLADSTASRLSPETDGCDGRHSTKKQVNTRAIAVTRELQCRCAPQPQLEKAPLTFCCAYSAIGRYIIN